VEPLTVPCIEPFPIMLLAVSLIFIVPVMALVFWARVQVILSWPLVSADVPVHVPERLVSVPGELGVGVAGEEVDPPHAATATRLKTTKIAVRMAHSPSGLWVMVEMGCPTSHYNRFTRSASGDAMTVTPAISGDSRLGSVVRIFHNLNTAG